MADVFMGAAQSTIESKLHEKGYLHLKVRIHGKNLVIYSEDNDGKYNRARLTRHNAYTYQIGMADHRGKWERTPFVGTLSEMIDVLTQQFSFVLAKW